MGAFICPTILLQVSKFNYIRNYAQLDGTHNYFYVLFVFTTEENGNDFVKIVWLF